MAHSVSSDHWHDLGIFRAAFQHAWNAIVITDADPAQGYRVQFANQAFCRMTGYALQELQGRTLKMLQGPDTDPAVIERLRDCLQEARYFEGTTVNYRKDGSDYVVRWNISPVRNDLGELTHFVSVQQDLSDLVRSQGQNLLLERALDATTDQVMLMDAQLRIVLVNASFVRVNGYPIEEVLGKTPAFLRSGAHDPAFFEALHASLQQGEHVRAVFVNKRRDGTVYHAEQSISPITDDKGRITHYVSVSKDVSDRVAREQALRHVAIHDKLTGLYNRHHGEQLLEQAHEHARQLGRSLTLLVCDIDHFKRINDRYGHLAGDRVLSEVARAVGQGLRGSDAVIRWGGEEFVVLLADCAQEPAQALAEQMRRRVQDLQDAEVGPVTLSLGLATWDGQEAMSELLARADAALYQAKQGGRNRVAVSPRAASTPG